MELNNLQKTCSMHELGDVSKYELISLLFRIRKSNFVKR